MTTTVAAIPEATTRRPRALVTALLFALAGGIQAEPALAAEELVLIPDPQLLLIMVAGFVILIFPLNALLFKPVFAALDARSERIDGARQRSAQLEQEADSVLGRYETAIREARSEAETQRQTQLERAREEQLEVTGAARQEAEGELERARAELSQSLETARATLRASAENLAQDAAEQILGRKLS
ncbi:MAG: ATP synthase F0 subunit B [Deltaproteobacteria bacterium]|jgi:F-type H+-transporting ATPase subunit b|nr:ATP synthase F0 subunit B [Deltaproteobacteria bacterium]MBW2500555.1 ATP synthase F0 subunit B [Deltaproteobacteria bacterium]